MIDVAYSNNGLPEDVVSGGARSAAHADGRDKRERKVKVLRRFKTVKWKTLSLAYSESLILIIKPLRCYSSGVKNVELMNRGWLQHEVNKGCIELSCVDLRENICKSFW